MLHQEIEIIDGKTLSYVKLNDWCEKVDLFFHDFMGLKRNISRSREMLNYVYYHLTDRGGGVIYHFLLYYGTTSSKK